MRRGEKFVTMVDGARMFAMAVASLFLLAGTATAAHAADVAAPAAPPLFDTLDVNKDQVLSRQEFQSGYAGLQRLIATQVRLREQFATLDADRSGAIDAGEYANLELIKSRGRAAPSLTTFDADRNHKLDFAEYATLVRKLATAHAPTKK